MFIESGVHSLAGKRKVLQDEFVCSVHNLFLLKPHLRGGKRMSLFWVWGFGLFVCCFNLAKDVYNGLNSSRYVSYCSEQLYLDVLIINIIIIII